VAAKGLASRLPRWANSAGRLKIPSSWPILRARPRSRSRRSIYKGAKAVWLGAVEAPDQAAVIEKAAAEFKVPANRLMAVRR
jgi:hypothetical protein